MTVATPKHSFRSYDFADIAGHAAPLWGKSRVNSGDHTFKFDPIYYTSSAYFDFIGDRVGWLYLDLEGSTGRPVSPELDLVMSVLRVR